MRIEAQDRADLEQEVCSRKFKRHSQKPVQLTRWVFRETLLNYEENFSKCPI